MESTKRKSVMCARCPNLRSGCEGACQITNRRSDGTNPQYQPSGYRVGNLHPLFVYDHKDGTSTHVPEGQGKKHSWYEAWVNVAVGILVSMLANWLILPAVLGVPVSIGNNILIAALFTLVSLVRSYTLRRLFNWLHLKGNK